MGKPSLNSIKKYIVGINKVKTKYVTCYKLSRVIGVYPDIIAENLSYFEPMLKMDDTVDIRPLVPKLKEYAYPVKKEKTQTVHKVSRIDTSMYKGINDFIYKRYTIGGFFTPEAKLTKDELKILEKLVKEEIKKKK